MFSGGIFHRNMVLEGVAGISVFGRCYRNLLQEFLWDRDSCSCIFTGFLRIPDMVQAWVAKKLVNVTYLIFFMSDLYIFKVIIR